MDPFDELDYLRQQDQALRTLYRVSQGMDTVTGIHERLREYISQKYTVDYDVAQRAVAECLSTQDPVLAFAAWYNTWLDGRMAFAQHYGVTETKLGMAITLFRLAPFQVQLFLFRNGAVITPHIHPDVESYEVYIAGDMELTKDEGMGLLIPQVRRNLAQPDSTGRCRCNGAMLRVPAACAHGGHIFTEEKTAALRTFGGKWGPFGGAFMSIQYWLNGKIPESIQYNWAGLDGTEEG